MAKATQRKAAGGLLAKARGAREAFEAHKADETTIGSGGDVPAGIDGGVARLVECKIDLYKSGDNKDQPYFRAVGIAVAPKKFNGVPLEGLRTTIMEPLCETEKRGEWSRSTFEEHLAWTLNELRKLGVDTSELELEDLESAMEALKEAKPHFRFRTWASKVTKEYPNPRTNHQWAGVLEDYAEEDTPDVDEDEVEEEAEEEEAVKEGRSAADWGALADEGDEEAQKKLTKEAKAAGIDPDDYPTWTELAEAVEPEEEEGEDGEEEEEEEEEKEEEETQAPGKGDVYLYKPPRAKKAVECSVEAVFAGKETVNLKNLDDGKTIYKSVPWSELQGD